MIVGMAVLVTVCSIDASTITSISAAVTYRRSNTTFALSVTPPRSFLP
jgi:hypothetical protein